MQSQPCVPQYQFQMQYQAPMSGRGIPHVRNPSFPLSETSFDNTQHIMNSSFTSSQAEEHGIMHPNN